MSRLRTTVEESVLAPNAAGYGGQAAFFTKGDMMTYERLQKKLKRAKTWFLVSGIIFFLTFITALLVLLLYPRPAVRIAIGFSALLLIEALSGSTAFFFYWRVETLRRELRPYQNRVKNSNAIEADN